MAGRKGGKYPTNRGCPNVADPRRAFFFSKLQEVLAEIQRLKEEANRFISILAEEDDPEKANELLSPGKRQSLTREVESLQVRIRIYIALLSHYRD